MVGEAGIWEILGYLIDTDSLTEDLFLLVASREVRVYYRPAGCQDSVSSFRT